jgi:hypothetical protein
MRHSFICVFLLAAFCSCGSLRKIPEAQLVSDQYLFRQPGERYQKAYLDVQEDSISIIPIGKNAGARLAVKPFTDELLLKRTFDIDVLVVPFKLRPSAYNFPVQLNSDYNGNFFLGYRLDRFKVRYAKTPVGFVRQIHHRALTAGAFGGIGTAFISPWTTNYRTTDEYNAFIFSRGLSVMFGLNDLTVGLGVGWDYLTDRDKSIWIYQNEAWYGLTVSINLN